MHVYQIEYDTILSLQQLPIEEINSFKSVWIHVTTTLQSHANVEKILHELKMLFPESSITGIRTEGSIAGKDYDLQGTHITLTAFEESDLILQYIETPDHQKTDQWIETITELSRDKTVGLALFFADPLRVDAEEIVKLFHTALPEFFPLAQLASDGKRDYDSYVIAEEKVLKGGVTLLLVTGTSFRFAFTHIEDLTTFGLPFHITNAKGRRLYDIDGLHATTFLSKELGETYVRNLPESGWRITVAMERNGRLFPRTPLKVAADRSILYAASIKNDTLCRFVYLDENQSYLFHRPVMTDKQTPSLYFYFADVVHRLSRRKKMAHEVEVLAEQGLLSGAYGFGVITLVNGEIVAFNQLSSILMMAETEENRQIEILSEKVTVPRYQSDILKEALDHYLGKEVSKIEVLYQLGKNWLERLEASFVYNRNLQLIAVSKDADQKWAIRLRIDFSDDLTKLDDWIVQNLRKGLEGSLVTAYGSFLEPTTGKRVRLALHITPLRDDSENVIGGIVKLTRVS